MTTGWDYEHAEYYRDMTTAELIQRAKDADRAIRRFENETPDWRDDEAVTRNYELTMRQYRVRSAIQEEIDRQKLENKSGLAQMGKAINAWFTKQELASPAAINVTWVVQDRQFSGRFYPDSGKLDVSITVAEGTTGAQRRGSRYYLRCNTVEELRNAIATTSGP